MTITTMDRKAVNLLGDEALAALQEVAERHGITVKREGGKYDPATGTFTPKLTFALDDAAQREWDRYATLYGFESDDFGRTFTNGGRTFEVIGIKPRSPKRPIIAKGSDGKEYVFPIESVQAGLKQSA